MSKSVIQAYVDAYETLLHDGAISMTESGTRHETYDLWATPEEFDHLMKLQFVAIQAIERGLINMVRYYRKQGMTEKLEVATRLLAQARGENVHPYVWAWDYLSFYNV